MWKMKRRQSGGKEQAQEEGKCSGLGVKSVHSSALWEEFVFWL